MIVFNKERQAYSPAFALVFVISLWLPPTSALETYIGAANTETCTMSGSPFSLQDLLTHPSGVCSHIIGRDAVQTRDTLPTLQTVRGVCKSLRHVESSDYSHAALERLYTRRVFLDGELTRLTPNNVLRLYRYAPMAGLHTLVSDMRMYTAFKKVETKILSTIYLMLKTVSGLERGHLASQMMAADVMTGLLDVCRAYADDTTIQIMGITTVKLLSLAGPRHQVLAVLAVPENLALVDALMHSLDALPRVVEDISSARQRYCRIYEFLFADASAPVFSTAREQSVVDAFLRRFVHWTTLGLPPSHLRKHTQSMSNILEKVPLGTLSDSTKQAVLASIANI